MKCLRIAVVGFTLAACRRTPPQAPPVAAPIASADGAAPVAPREPSADALVLSPGEGIGPFSLGMSRSAVQSLGAQPRALTSRELGLDGFELSFDDDAPAGVLVSIRVTLREAAGGVRVGTAVLANGATYDDVIAAVGPCAARVLRRGGNTTPCQGGAVNVLESGPSGAVGLEVAR